MAPVHRLVEQELSEVFQATRSSSVRETEALQDLAADGLVELIPRCGGAQGQLAGLERATQPRSCRRAALAAVPAYAPGPRWVPEVTERLPAAS